jgi:hypothetical protein
MVILEIFENSFFKIFQDIPQNKLYTFLQPIDTAARLTHQRISYAGPASHKVPGLKVFRLNFSIPSSGKIG